MTEKLSFGNRLKAGLASKMMSKEQKEELKKNPQILTSILSFMEMLDSSKIKEPEIYSGVINVMGKNWIALCIRQKD